MARKTAAESRRLASYGFYLLACISLLLLITQFRLTSSSPMPARNCVLDEQDEKQNEHCHSVNIRPSEDPAPSRFSNDSGLAVGDSMGEMRALGKSLDELPVGFADIRAPINMKVGQLRRVSVLVYVEMDTKAANDAQKKDKEQQIKADLHVSPEMAASLDGDSFKITPLTSETQMIASRHPTIWTWKIEPTEDGPQTLNVSLFAMLKLDEQKSIKQRVSSYETQISVAVRDTSWSDWIKSSKEDVDTVNTLFVGVSGICTAGFGALGFFMGRRKKSEGRRPTASASSD